MISRTLVFSALLSVCACGSTSSNLSTQDVDGQAAVVKSSKKSVVGAERISMVYFAPNQNLYIGTQTGNLAEIDVANQKGSVSRVAQSSGVVLTSPNGEQTVVNASPPVVTALDGSLVLQMSLVKNFASAVFSPDGKVLYVGDKGGKLRIWGQAHSFTKQGKDERLENYLNRQAPDFLVQFPSIEGEIASTGSGVLLIPQSDGTISAWDPKSPGDIQSLMKVKGTVKSMQATAQNVVTTSDSGYLKVGRVSPPSYLPWSKDVRADYVAIRNSTGSDFVMLDSEGVKMKNIDNGSQTWSLALPPGQRCGLDVSDNGQEIAACVGNVVYLINGSGKLMSQVFVKGKIEFMN